MPNKPKPAQTATGVVIKPKAKTKTKVFDQQTMKKEQLKKNKKPSKGGTGYKNYGTA